MEIEEDDDDDGAATTMTTTPTAATTAITIAATTPTTATATTTASITTTATTDASIPVPPPPSSASKRKAATLAAAAAAAAANGDSASAYDWETRVDAFGYDEYLRRSASYYVDMLKKQHVCGTCGGYCGDLYYRYDARDTIDYAAANAMAAAAAKVAAAAATPSFDSNGGAGGAAAPLVTNAAGDVALTGEGLDGGRNRSVLHGADGVGSHGNAHTLVVCAECYNHARYPQLLHAACFERVDNDAIRQYESYARERAEATAALGAGDWTDQELLLLLSALETHGDDWRAVADAVGGGKTPKQCVLQFMSLPLVDGGDYRPRRSLLRRRDGGDNDVDNEMPFVDAPNPVETLVAFLTRAVDFEIGAAAGAGACEALETTAATAAAAAAANAITGEVDPAISPRAQLNADNGDKITAADAKAVAAAALKAAASRSLELAAEQEARIRELALEAAELKLRSMEAKLDALQELDRTLEKEKARVEEKRDQLVLERAMLERIAANPPNTELTTLAPTAHKAMQTAVEEQEEQRRKDELELKKRAELFAAATAPSSTGASEAMVDTSPEPSLLQPPQPQQQPPPQQQQQQQQQQPPPPAPLADGAAGSAAESPATSVATGNTLGSAATFSNVQFK